MKIIYFLLSVSRQQLDGNSKYYILDISRDVLSCILDYIFEYMPFQKKKCAYLKVKLNSVYIINLLVCDIVIPPLFNGNLWAGYMLFLIEIWKYYII